MKKMTKILCAVMALVLAVGAGVGGTLAWLTSTTDQVVNTVTAVAGLKITLDEAKVDEYGVPVDDTTRTLTNSYKLLPGQTYTKDPTVHLAADSEPCYIFVKVNNGLEGFIISGHKPGPDLDGDGYGDKTLLGLHEQIAEVNGWTPLRGRGVYYKQIDAATAKAGTDLVVFNEFHVASDKTNATLKGAMGKTITIDAYACQSEGFKNADDAWMTNFGK